MNTLLATKILSCNQSQVIEQAKFTRSPLAKASEKQIKKQVYTLKSLSLSNKIDELNQIKNIFPQN